VGGGKKLVVRTEYRGKKTSNRTEKEYLRGGPFVGGGGGGRVPQGKGKTQKRTHREE